MQNKPTIAVIGGTGSLGSGLAKLWAMAGYPVVLGSRSKGKAEASARELAGGTGNVRGDDNRGAARAGDIVVLAIPYSNHDAIVNEIKSDVAGKIVVDATVPLVPPKVFVVQLPADGSPALVAQRVFGPDVRVVSAFHNVGAKKFETGRIESGSRTDPSKSSRRAAWWPRRASDLFRGSAPMGPALRFDLRARLVLTLLVWMFFAPLRDLSAQQILLPDLDNRLVDPLHVRVGARATVLLFTSSDCPISNRYAPEVRRLYEKFTSAGAVFWLIYPNPADSPNAIRDHVKTYGYPMSALRDAKHALVNLIKVSVTPEAAVLDARGRIVYRGRIDDRYVDVSRQRPAPTRHDLEDALSATLAGKPVAQATTQAVGCFIADFRP